jgi:NADH dehydrogenase FAD-containing subunit
LAYGAKPRGDIIRTLSPALYNPTTYSIKVKDTLQVADNNHPNIFAAGDVADTQDLKMAYKAGLHAPIVAKNILGLIKKETPGIVYKPTTGSEMMALPFGKNGGVSYLSFFGGIDARFISRADDRLHSRQLAHQNAQREDVDGSQRSVTCWILVNHTAFVRSHSYEIQKEILSTKKS